MGAPSEALRLQVGSSLYVIPDPESPPHAPAILGLPRRWQESFRCSRKDGKAHRIDYSHGSGWTQRARHSSYHDCELWRYS